MGSPLDHKNPETTDHELVREAHEHFNKDRAKQVVAICIDLMREQQFLNITFTDLHKRFPAKERMLWLKQRADIRQAISTDLAGTPLKTARKRDPNVQAESIEEVIECGDKTTQQFDLAFPSETLATYGDIEGFAQFFFDKFDWKDTKNKARQIVVARLLNEFLVAPKGLKPILTHLEFRRAIPNSIWHMFVPLELRAEIDDARLAKLADKDKSKEPWTAEEELRMAKPDLLVNDNIPLIEFIPIFKAWMKASGFRLSSEMPVPEAPHGDPVEPPPTSAQQDSNKPTVAPAPMSNDGPRAAVPPALKPVAAALAIKPPIRALGPSNPGLPPANTDDNDADFDAQIDRALTPQVSDPKASSGR